MLTLLVAFLVALAPQVRPGSIEGVVVRVGTTEPIAKAIVEITGGNGSHFASATASDGRFEFKNLSPGSYKVTVSKNGYLNGAYGQRGPNGQPGTLRLEANQAMKDVRVTMVPTGAISGRVYDISGEPLANVSVQAFKYTYGEEGVRVLTSIKGVQTDDRGEYRLFWLPPGRYYISAAPQGAHPDGFVFISNGGTTATHVQGIVLDSRGVAIKDSKETIEKLGEAYVPIYYPGAMDPQDAEALDLGPGSEIRADFGLPRVTSHKVRGIVIDGTTGQPVTNANILLISVSGGLRTSLRPIAASDGSFEIPDVLPGSYVLSATRRTTDPGTRETVQISGGRVRVDVSNADVERVTLVMSPGIDVAGQLTMDAVLRPRDGTDGILRPVVTLKNELAGIPMATNFSSDYTSETQFVFNRVVEGDYHVELTYLPPGTYVKSVRFGGSDALNGSIRIEPGSNSRFEIALGMGSGAVDGTAVNAKGERAGNVTVALIPAAPQRQRGDLYKSFMTDDNGHFHFQGVPPGDYSVFAWEDIENGRWRDPDFIRGNENSGRPVHVAEGTQGTVEVTAIPFAY